MAQKQDFPCGVCGSVIKGSCDPLFSQRADFCGYIIDDRQVNASSEPSFSCRTCSEEYYRALDAEFRPLAHRYAINKGLKQSDAADITQESLWKLHDQLIHDHNKEGLQPRRMTDQDISFAKHVKWFLGIVRNDIRNHRRKVARGPKSLSTIPYRDSVSRVDCITESQLAMSVRDEEEQLLRDALDELPDKERAALLRWKLNGEPAHIVADDLGYAEVSGVYHAAQRAVKTLMARFAVRNAGEKSQEPIHA